MDVQEDHELEFESRWEAAVAVGLVVCLQVLLAVTSAQKGWKLWELPWWAWLVPVGPELALVIALAWTRPRHKLEQRGLRRTFALGLVGLITAANVLSLIALIASLTTGQEKSGGQLLLKGLVVWSTNVIAFGLWFWEFARGGPVKRFTEQRPPDFQFPQMENPQLAAPGWHPRLTDYAYISFTNSIAFSPTDAMPLSRWAKLLMLAESAVSAVTILLVAARAVNIFK
jgi:predicted nucleic acid-binding protein